MNGNSVVGVRAAQDLSVFRQQCQQPAVRDVGFHVDVHEVVCQRIAHRGRQLRNPRLVRALIAIASGYFCFSMSSMPGS